MATLVEGSSPTLLDGRRIGLERESLRVDAEGAIASTDHPEALGSALCHGSVTTDFSEALVEMVTPPMRSAAAALGALDDVHRFVAERLENDETLWSASMPCVLSGDESIRIGEYGSSHAGRMKHAYRRGLGVRYGRRMQAIAGIHFNFSLPDDAWRWRAANGGGRTGVSDGYFAMMQNLIGIGWLVPWLFGASPAICRTFLVPGTVSDLDEFGGSTRFAPHGTSLRMGNIGYRYREDQAIDLSVDHRGLACWIDDVIGHVTQRHPPYADIGLFDERGERQQLNASRLQIENEYYGTVRPKQIPEPGEMPILALQRRGVRYLELRSLDVDPFEPSGLSLHTIAFLEMMMLFAWLADPLPLDDADMERTKENLKRVAHRGREPGLALRSANGSILLSDWVRAILTPMNALADWLDAGGGDGLYRAALDEQFAKLDDPALLPSARVLAGVQEAGSFAEFTAWRSLVHHEMLTSAPPSAGQERALEQEVQDSRVAQAAMEAASTGSFDDYLADYFSQLADGAELTGSPRAEAEANP